MFRLRIHTLDTPSCLRHQLPRIEESKGTVHLFRLVSHRPDPLPSSAQPGTSTLLFVLAVPARFSPEDFLLFCGSYAERVSLLRFIRNDGIEDRCSVLINFEDQRSANGFYRNFNGQRFSSSEAEVCRLLFTIDVEYTEYTEIAERAPDGLTELPSCPICLERLDQDTSGIVTTRCDHSFQCSCTLKWTDSSCPLPAGAPLLAAGVLPLPDGALPPPTGALLSPLENRCCLLEHCLCRRSVGEAPVRC